MLESAVEGSSLCWLILKHIREQAISLMKLNKFTSETGLQMKISRQSD
jgi:hypothetical protein